MHAVTCCDAPCISRCASNPVPGAARCLCPQEDVLLQHVSGEQLVFDAVVEGVLQLLQVSQPLCGRIPVHTPVRLLCGKADGEQIAPQLELNKLAAQLRATGTSWRWGAAVVWYHVRSYSCWPPQLPVAVGEAECPETLLLDRGRLVAAQNELQRLSLTAAALLIAAQLLAMKRLPPGTSSPENRRCGGGGLRGELRV
jgi:T-complex protein 11